MKLKLGIPGIIFLCLCSPGHAESLKIKPGLWEITTTVSGMMQPQTKTVKECIQEDSIDPKEMMQDMPSDDCTVDANVSGNIMTYNLSCNMHGMVMEGAGKMESNVDSMNGTMQFKGNMNGMVMEMTSSSEGRRLGDC